VGGRVPLLVNAYASRVGDEFEPTRVETPAPVPTWAWVLSLVVVAWALYYLTAEYRHHAMVLEANAPTQAAVSAVPESVARTDERANALGAQVFGNYCAACHQLTGEGIPGVFPPLRGDPVVNAEDPTEHIRVVLGGRSGVAIGGVSYAAAMPPLGGQLSDEQIAAVLTHERSSWGNAARAVTTAEVTAVRAASSGRQP
jgi:mono/diheme cytochrome c family protein